MSAIARARELMDSGLISADGTIYQVLADLISECEEKDEQLETLRAFAIPRSALEKRIAELEEEVDALNDEIDGWKGIKKRTAADCAEIAENHILHAPKLIKEKYGV
jgi:chromosome segregation ATPase